MFFLMYIGQDRYILGTMIFLFLVTGWHSLVAQLDENIASDADQLAFIVFICVYVVLHLVFTFSMIIRVCTVLTLRKIAI